MTGTYRLSFALMLFVVCSYGCVSRQVTTVSKPERLPANSDDLAEDTSMAVRPDTRVSQVSLVVDQSHETRHGRPAPLPSDGEIKIQQVSAPTAGEGAERENAPDVHPIDLANALGLGGASHLQIRLARERVIEAQANYLEAKTLWLPSLRFGIGWNKHDGRIQETEGNILEVSRNSLFVGGGLGLGEGPLTGASSGPARLIVDLSLADAIFEHRVKASLLASSRAATNHVFNDSLLQISTAYFDLLEAYSNRANAEIALAFNDELERITTLFAEEGAGNYAEVDRAKTATSLQKRKLADARREIAIASAQLIKLLRLDPHLTLAPVEESLAPMEVVDASLPLSDLIAQGRASRPELSRFRALINASAHRVNQEFWRPWLPNVLVGTSAGSFGGGPSTRFENQAGRSDIELLAVWEIENLGYGNRAARCRNWSQLRQSQIVYQDINDRIAAEIASAFGEIQSYRDQMAAATESLKTAQDSYTKNKKRVEEGEGLPIELLQALDALNESRNTYAAAVAEFNRAQFRLLRAIGTPPGASSMPAPNGS